MDEESSADEKQEGRDDEEEGDGGRTACPFLPHVLYCLAAIKLFFVFFVVLVGFRAVGLLL